MALTLMIRNAMSVNLPQYQPKNKCDSSHDQTLVKNSETPWHHQSASFSLAENGFSKSLCFFNENITPLLVVLLIELNREDYHSWRTPVEF